MDRFERKCLYERARRKWGIEAQKMMVYEECGELLNVLAKEKRKRKSKKEIIAELANVYIMLEQMIFFYGVEDFWEELDKKLHRLKTRLNELEKK